MIGVAKRRERPGPGAIPGQVAIREVVAIPEAEAASPEEQSTDIAARGRLCQIAAGGRLSGQACPS